MIVLSTSAPTALVLPSIGSLFLLLFYRWLTTMLTVIYVQNVIFLN